MAILGRYTPEKRRFTIYRRYHEYHKNYGIES